MLTISDEQREFMLFVELIVKGMYGVKATAMHKSEAKDSQADPLVLYTATRHQCKLTLRLFWIRRGSHTSYMPTLVIGFDKQNMTDCIALHIFPATSRARVHSAVHRPSGCQGTPAPKSPY